MNYFRCTVGGSGGKLKLTVTCTNVFAGLTITCTDGTTTLTKTCPSSSPYTVVFNIPNVGTWTISGVYGGKTNTTTVVIPDTATLNYIPTGSTATPTNDIQTWLHCANIWNKTYTTINQVLADTSTLLALISSNNAADYMARSTNWASSVCANQTAMGYIGNNDYCAKKLLSNSTWCTSISNSTYFESVLNKKMATMTGATTPSGYQVAASTEYSSNYGWHAADGIYPTTPGQSTNRSGWDATTTTNSWIYYKFPEAFSAKKFVFRSDALNDTTLSRTPKNYKIQGSNTGGSNDWTDIGATRTLEKQISNTVIVNDSNANYSYYKIYVLDNYGGPNIEIIELEIYGRTL